MAKTNSTKSIRVKIDVTKIDPAMLYEGKQGKYLTFYLNETPNAQYSDYMAVVAADKEGRYERTQLGDATDMGGAKQEAKFAGSKPKASSKLPWE